MRPPEAGVHKIEPLDEREILIDEELLELSHEFLTLGVHALRSFGPPRPSKGVNELLKINGVGTIRVHELYHLDEVLLAEALLRSLLELKSGLLRFSEPFIPNFLPSLLRLLQVYLPVRLPQCVSKFYSVDRIRVVGVKDLDLCSHGDHLHLFKGPSHVPVRDQTVALTVEHSDKVLNRFPRLFPPPQYLLHHLERLDPHCLLGRRPLNHREDLLELLY
mmetsp:Transcript_13193/g.26901  ORF Transcript_13193/g.26901 Transcript_13193/m.26901 type:complete len:219 (-) Transcript_13193:403-1059(-)